MVSGLAGRREGQFKITAQKLEATFAGGLFFDLIKDECSAGRTRTYNPSVNSRMLCH